MFGQFKKPTMLLLAATLAISFLIGGCIHPTTGNYIGNRGTGIFHKSTCHYVNKMSESNKIGFENRQQAIDKGYRPCKKCKP